MNKKEEFVSSRVVALVEKIEAILDAGRAPSSSEVSYFEKCWDVAAKVAPFQELHTAVILVRSRIKAAQDRRALWLSTRAEALAQKADTRKAKADLRAAAKAKGGKPFSAVEQAKLEAELIKEGA
jgi:hypothetical protein